jgi:hypothetical protein
MAARHSTLLTGSEPWFAQSSEAWGEMRFLPDEFEVPGGCLVTIRDGLVTCSQLFVDQQKARAAAGLQTN